MQFRHISQEEITGLPRPKQGVCRPGLQGIAGKFFPKAKNYELTSHFSYGIFCSYLLERVFPKQNDRRVFPAKAIRTAGSDAENCQKWQLATSVALLIELEAQFYKLVTINQCLTAYTCEMVNKSSKSIFAI